MWCIPLALARERGQGERVVALKWEREQGGADGSLGRLPLSHYDEKRGL
jgi:hypothetical protein